MSTYRNALKHVIQLILLLADSAVGLKTVLKEYSSWFLNKLDWGYRVQFLGLIHFSILINKLDKEGEGLVIKFAGNTELDK